MFEDLAGKVAVVTGGTGVLGQSMCHALAAQGAKVAILATTPSKIDSLVEDITQAGHTAWGTVADVLDRSALESAAQAIMTEFGQIDILINGAGGNHPNATTNAQQAFFDLPQEAIQHVFNLNFLGSFLPAQVFGRLMGAHGVILNVSSMASMQPLTRVVAYGAAKAAINNFTQWLAVHLAQEISPTLRVNAIAPGFFLTDQNRYLLTTEDKQLTARGQQILDHTPMARFGEPDDLAGTVLWLVSDASRFVTGIVVPVDGGFSAFSGV